MGYQLCASDLEFFAIEGEEKSWGYEIPKDAKTQGVISIAPDNLSTNSSFVEILRRLNPNGNFGINLTTGTGELQFGQFQSLNWLNKANS